MCKGYAVSTYFRPNGKFSKQFAMPLTDLVITIWCLESSTVLMNLKTPFLSIRNIAISSDQTALAVNGLDTDQRELIVVYSFTDLVKYQKIELLARQLTDFKLTSLKFI